VILYPLLLTLDFLALDAVNILKRVMHSNDFAILKGLAAQLVR
jgi:hypothetical protein